MTSAEFRAIRQLGLTQAELAGRLGMTQPMVSRIERGERVTRELTLKVVNVYEGNFGPFYIAIYNDDEGNTFVYKGSAPKGTKGEKSSFTFTIKEHSEYKGKKNNIVARIKINR